MKVKMLQTTPGRKMGDVQNTIFEKGRIYEIDNELCDCFIEMGVVEIVKDVDQKPHENRQTAEGSPSFETKDGSHSFDDEDEGDEGVEEIILEGKSKEELIEIAANLGIKVDKRNSVETIIDEIVAAAGEAQESEDIGDEQQ